MRKSFLFVTVVLLLFWTSLAFAQIPPGGGGSGSSTAVGLVTVTQPATGATLTIVDGKTFTVSKTLTLTGTDGTTMTFPSTSATIARTDAANTFTGVQTMTSPQLTTPAITTSATITRLAVGVTSADGIVLTNTTAAAAGAQQWSPRLHFTGQGWKTDATAASQAVDWIAEAVPVQGTANPSVNLVFSASINGGAYTQKATLTSATIPVFVFGDGTNPGQLTFGAATSSWAGFGVLSAAHTVTASLLGDNSNFAAHQAANFYTNGDYNASSTGTFRFTDGDGRTGTADVVLRRDAANVLAQRNGASAQAFRVANTFTSLSNMEYAGIEWATNVAKIGAFTVGGTLRNVNIVGTQVLVDSLKTTGAATGKTVVCVDTATGQLYASTSGVACAN